MRRHQFQNRAKSKRIFVPLLPILVLFLNQLGAPTSTLGQTGGTIHDAVSSGSAENTGAVAGSVAPKAPPAPDAPLWPFLRVAAVLLSGLVISMARLARMFRRFWGLGVFTNPYAVLFLIFGVGVSGIPVTSESALASLPHLQSLGPWIADLAGIIVALTLPLIHFKKEERPAAENQVRDLEEVSSSNPVLAVIEDAIRDRILERMQREVMVACRRYDWVTIKIAASRALEEEMTVRPLGRDEYEVARKSIEGFRASPDVHVDSRDKYEAMLRLLRWCSFKRLLRGLDAATREAQV